MIGGGKMRNGYIKTLCVLLIVLMVFGLSACTDAPVTTNKNFDSKALSEKFPDGTVICENKRFSLIWKSSNCGVILKDKESGLTWGSAPDIEGEPLVDALGMPIKKHPQVESTVAIEYLNPDTRLEEQAFSYNSAVKNGRVRAKKIDNGVRVEYYFDDVEIKIPVEFILREDSLSVSVDPKEIEENEQKVVAVSLMPFLCSVPNDAEDSYLFYPSGSGALIYPDTVSQMGTAYTSQVYGTDPTMTKLDMPTTEENVLLPVCGAKYKNTASCAIIESASESALIEAKVGAEAIKYTGVYAKFQVRGYCSNTARFMQGMTKKLNVYSDEMISDVMTVGYYPLANEKANYSGMAEIYKNYLKREGFLNNKVNQEPLYVTLIGGAMINKSFLGIPYKDLLASTTLNQSKDILSSLKEITDEPINARLIGFGQDGLDNYTYAGGFKIDKNLGDLKDLSNLSDYCDKNNVNLFFDFDLIKLKKSSSGFNKYFDVAHSATNKLTDVYDYNVVTRSRIEESKYRLLSRELLPDSAEKMLNKIQKWNLNGISLSSLSSVAYSDYSIKQNAKYYSKGNMINDVTAIFNKVSDKYRISSEAANSYAAVLSDAIYNSPTSSSKEIVFGEDVPFYQMVFKGYVSLSSGEINLAATPKNEVLKALESGCALNYVVASEYYNEYIDYNGYEFAMSKFSDVKQQIAKDYSFSSKYLRDIKDAEIISHEILENGLRKTIFSNGTSIYVNYTKNNLTSPLGEVESQGYIWGEEAA